LYVSAAWSHCIYRCGIYPVRPFSCDFEIIRCEIGDARPTNRIAVEGFQRGWNMTRAVDHGKGTLCQILEPSNEPIENRVAHIQDTVRKLKRLEEWALHFNLKNTWIPQIINFFLNTKGDSENIVLIP